MTPEQLPPDALFIRWGHFQAGAFGRLAIVVLACIVLALVLWRLW